MDIKDLRRLQRKAKEGDRASIDALISVTNAIAGNVNKRMRALEQARYDYGAYGIVEHFTGTQYGTNRFKTANALQKDIDDMVLQSQIGMKFLKERGSDVVYMEEQERKRIATFIERGVFPENISIRQARNFLRFLGREESQEFKDAYGNSDTVVEMMYDAYTKRNNSREKMSRAFSEYLARRGRDDTVTFAETMERLGIDIADYPRTE
mgnify:CR=1 FL=1